MALLRTGVAASEDVKCHKDSGTFRDESYFNDCMIGTTLSHYQITSQLGVGGMGEVYRARDSRLGREVVIKVLPVSFEPDKERLKRFEREARLLASLNHPHIASIHGRGDGRSSRKMAASSP